MVIAICGMPGSGKSKAIAYLIEKYPLEKVYFGGIVKDIVIERFGTISEDLENQVRLELREKHGMGAMAVLSLPKIESYTRLSKHVVIDGLYSWSEYKLLKENFGDDLVVISIHASPTVRHKRLETRKERPIAQGKSRERDHREIELMEKGGPIAMADYVIVNESSVEEFYSALDKIVTDFKL